MANRLEEGTYAEQKTIHRGWLRDGSHVRWPPSSLSGGAQAGPAHELTGCSEGNE